MNSLSPSFLPSSQTLYPYTGQFADELSFPSDMLIALTRQVNEDWYEGSLNGHTGLVPKNYLQILQPPVTQDPIDTIQDSVGHMTSVCVCVCVLLYVCVTVYHCTG